VKDHLIIVDASGFAFRAFYTFPAFRRDSDGEPTGAILGFMKMIWRMQGAAQHDAPTLAAAVFDPPDRKNFRHKLYPAYKANRDPARSLELEKQLPTMRPIAEALGLHAVEVSGFEADDVIATMAAQARAKGIRVTIVSSDKDFGQLVVDGEVEIVDPMQKRRILAVDVEEKFGVPPGLVPHVQALAGDSVDGFPGIPGCGLKRAAGLIRRWGNLEKVLAHAEEVPWPSVAHEMVKRKKDARLFLKLATLRTDVELPMAIEDMKAAPVMKRDLEAMLKALGAGHLMHSVFGLDPQLMPLVPHVEDQWGWWKRALRGFREQLPSIPQSGFYQKALVHRGPLVPGRIWREPEMEGDVPTGFDILRCEVNGKARDPFTEWVGLSMKPVDNKKYNFEVADVEHAQKWRPNDPKANPHQPIRLEEQPVSRNPRPIRRSSK
jgi:5'-3' exonuclease